MSKRTQLRRAAILFLLVTIVSLVGCRETIIRRNKRYTGTIPPGQEIQLSSKCEKGEIIVGGGYGFVQSGPGIRVIGDFPRNNGITTEWDLYFVNDGDKPIAYDVWVSALCIKDADYEEIVWE